MMFLLYVYISFLDTDSTKKGFLFKQNVEDELDGALLGKNSVKALKKHD